MLRVYLRNNRQLLKKLCRIANECLLEFLRRSLIPRRSSCPYLRYMYLRSSCVSSCR